MSHTLVALQGGALERKAVWNEALQEAKELRTPLSWTACSTLVLGDMKNWAGSDIKNWAWEHGEVAGLEK